MVKLLLVAPTINGSDIGEAWVAYQWAVHLSERFDVTVLTYRKRGAPPIAPQVPLARVIEFLEPPLVGRAERLNSLLKPGYFVFYARARAWLRQAQRRGERFDLGHQVVPVAMRYPSPLIGAGFPFLIGPVGGSLESPPGFVVSETGPWYLKLRALDRWRLRHDPALRRTYESADCVLAIADYVNDSLRGLRIKRVEVMSETGLVELPAADDRPVRPTATAADPVRLLFVGRVIRTKGARDLVAAMGLLKGQPVVADIVGDGFDLPDCTKLAQDLGVTDTVTFHGQQGRPEVHEAYRKADVFVFPSYREPGGNVVFEAMGHGLPLIVCDRGGPSAAVNDACAIRLRAENPQQLASDLAEAISDLVADPARRQAMGQAARERLAEVGLWPAKIDRISALYASLLASI